jgi:hypothetical protein
VTSVKCVHRALTGIESGRSGRDLAEQLHAFSTERLALTR